MAERRGVMQDRSPLTVAEKTLIEAAKTQVWTGALRGMLARAVEHRGLRVGIHDSPGDLVETLELLAQADSEDGVRWRS